ncbi:SMI1/KNR4 family protein [Clostridium kluyveri]|uniref:Cell wall assembly protein n=1 Tax=Clostridium kluyveri TaxID=1534 RepID=A0A1L5F7Z2_CLOKL|nr:SMI1/KNR4 family protein [Clostridium kluyveri]APM39146.1 cell wall assembly protein [Clostridium kluyveri]UZQ51473.1 SMI1/KNR4 family protein [Clostridium kluyveri]
MSYVNYQKAVEIMSKNKEKCHFIGERSEELIEKAEDALGIKFSRIYKEFLIKYGAGNYGAEEILGVIDDDFEESSVPDGIWYTLTEREEVDLPMNLVVIYETGGDELFCLDFNNLNEEKEPVVVAYIPGEDNKNQKYEKIADDFGDFLLQLVNIE